MSNQILYNGRYVDIEVYDREMARQVNEQRQLETEKDEDSNDAQSTD